MTTLHEAPAPGFDTPGDGALGRDFLNISEAAALFGVSRVSVWRWIRDGRLPAARLGHRTIRIKRDDLERLLVQTAPGDARAWLVKGRGAAPGPVREAEGLSAPGPDWREMGTSEHFVQFYDSDDFLLDAVGDFIDTALRAGDAGVVVATEAHRAGLEARLRASGLELDKLRAGGRYTALDAADTLSRFMLDGTPEPGRFAEAIGGVIRRAAGGGRRVRVFGEMVALLVAEGNPAAALHLEALWNDLREKHPFTLFCAYPMDRFAGEAFSELVGEVCAGHSRVIPAESYTALAGADNRARAIALLQQKARSLEVEIAERKRAADENALFFAREQAARAEAQAAEARYRGLFEGTVDAILLMDADTHILDANLAATELFGYTREELLAMSLGDTAAGGEQELAHRLVAGERPGTWRGEYEARRKDGVVVPVESRASLVELPSGPLRIVSIRDASERRRAEEVRARLAAIVASSEDAIISKTLDAIITSWNAGAERLYGYRADEVIGQPISLLIPPDQPNELPEIMRRLRRGERIEHYETRRVRKDGEVLDISITVSPICDASGRIVGASAIARDISERRALERERDAFLATVSHDLKNPLTSVKGVAQMLRRRLARDEAPDRERLNQGLAAIDEGATRAASLLDDLLDSARLRMGHALELSLAHTDLVAVARRVVVACQQATERHKVTLEGADSPLVGEWDEARLSRVIENLLANAVKYSPKGGPITVTLAREEGDAAGWAVARVADRGIGIPTDELPRVLGQFYRASNVGRIAGSGLGLAGVRQIVEQHGGQVTIESAPGEGTTVSVRLPLALPGAQAEPAA